MNKALKNQLRTAYADQLRSFIVENKPTDWQAEFGEFPPKQTAMRRYILYLLEKYREGEIYEAIRTLYQFNGTICESPDQIKRVNESNQHKAIENFFKGTASQVELLQFLARIFSYPVAYEMFEKEYVISEKPNLKPDSVLENGNQKTNKKPYKKTIFLQYGIVALIFLMVLSNFGLEYYQMASRFEQAEKTLDLIDSLSFEPKYLTREIIEQDTQKSFVGTQTKAEEIIEQDEQKSFVKAQTSENTEPLLYFTNNIFNTKFIYPIQKWHFETDPKGEDINSEYGKPYQEEIRPLKPFDNQAFTIANEEIWIRFNLKNQSDQKLYVDNLYLKIIGKHNLDSVSVAQNAWLPKNNEEIYEIKLDNFAQTYPFATFTALVPKESRHFSLRVSASKSLDKQIVRFRLIISANDGAGKRITIPSDKVYLLGRYGLL